MLLQTWQTDAELEDYKHHTALWEARVNQETARMQKEIAVNQDLIEAREDPSRPEHYQTVNPVDEYNGMLVQTDAELEDYKRHTALWEARVNNAAAQLGREIDYNEDITQARENPSRPEFYAQQNSKQEIYDGMLLQYHAKPIHSRNWYKEQSNQEEAYTI